MKRMFLVLVVSAVLPIAGLAQAQTKAEKAEKPDCSAKQTALDGVKKEEKEVAKAAKILAENASDFTLSRGFDLEETGKKAATAAKDKVAAAKKDLDCCKNPKKKGCTAEYSAATPTAGLSAPPVSTKPRHAHAASAPFAINDGPFEMVGTVGGSGVGVEFDIKPDQAGEFSASVPTGGRLFMTSDGRSTIFGPDVIHTWKGTIKYRGYVFESSPDNPLQFRVDAKLGYVYVRGSGKVKFPDGKVVSFPPAAPETTPAFAAFPQESKGQPPEAPRAKWTRLSQDDMEHLRPLENAISRALVLLSKRQYDKAYETLAAPRAVAVGEKQGKTKARVLEIKEKGQQFVDALTADLNALAPMKFEMKHPPEDSEEVVLFVSTRNIYFRIGHQWYLSAWE